MARELSDESSDPAAEAVQGTSEEERRCASCGVALSRYNPGPHCWQHTVGWPWRGPSARPRF